MSPGRSVPFDVLDRLASEADARKVVVAAIGPPRFTLGEMAMNGSRQRPAGAIVRVLDNNPNGADNGSTAQGPAILRAYAATDLGTTLYTSAARAADTGGAAVKFTVPVAANGYAYVGGKSRPVAGSAPWAKARFPRFPGPGSDDLV
jgi:hypothetical protein